MKVATLRELLFADDCALNSNTEAEMQQCVNHFSRACDNFGFTISTKKTEVMHQPAPRKMYHESHIFVHDEPLKPRDYFTLKLWGAQESATHSVQHLVVDCIINKAPGGVSGFRRPDAATRPWLEDLNIEIGRNGKRLYICLHGKHPIQRNQQRRGSQ